MALAPPFLQKVPALVANRRAQRIAALALGAVVLVLGLAHLALNSDAARRAIREAALEKLQARLGPVALGDRVEISWTGEAHLGPFAIPAGEGEPPLLHVDELRIRPALGSLLTLHPELSRVTLVDPAFEVDDQGKRLEAFRARLPRHAPGSGKSAPHALPVVVLDDARVTVERRGESAPIELGPFDARIAVRGEGEARRFDVRLSLGGGSVHATGTSRELVLTSDDLPLSALLPQSAGLPIAFTNGTLDGRIELERPDEGPIQARVDARLEGLIATGARLADTPVGPFDAQYQGTVALDRRAGTLSTTDSKLLLGKPRLELPFEASLELHPELSFSIDARLGPVDLQQVISALPAQLHPPPEAPSVDGAFRAEVRASGPVRRPDAWTVGVRLDTRDLKQKARAMSFALREPFVYHPDDEGGVPRTIQVGPRNPNYVPLDSLPPIVPEAVITSEDGNFYKHDGFDFDEIRDSIATAAEGERLRGGSTISQQLVKNLYLSRERTLARKVREAFVTLELEAALPKPRILEIYLNIIEWGPGVYGIGEAAHHYFGVDARQLTPKQAVFLATIIPNPIRFSVYFRKGATSKNWDDHMAHLIDKLHERGDLDDAQYQKAFNDPVVFRRAG